MASQPFTQDIFGRTPLNFGGAFAADSAHINLSLNCADCFGQPITSAGLVTQQLQIQYQQPITRLYELGTQNCYFVAGRPQGTANIAKILGPGMVMAELYSCLGNVCNANTNDLCFCIQGGCSGANVNSGYEAMQLCLKNVVMQSLGMTVQAQDMLVNEQMGLFFTAMLAIDAVACQASIADPVTCDCIPATGFPAPCGVVGYDGTLYYIGQIIANTLVAEGIAAGTDQYNTIMTAAINAAKTSLAAGQTQNQALVAATDAAEGAGL